MELITSTLKENNLLYKSNKKSYQNIINQNKNVKTYKFKG